MLHAAVYCLEPCPKPRKGCSHPCSKLCGDRCPVKCTVNVFKQDRVLPCGHPMPNLPCWQDQDLSTVCCEKVVKKTVPGCNHATAVPCHVDVTAPAYKCKVQC